MAKVANDLPAISDGLPNHSRHELRPDSDYRLWTHSKWGHLDRQTFRRANRLQLANAFNLAASLAFAVKSPNRPARIDLRTGKDNWLIHENAESGRASAAEGLRIHVD